MKQLSKKEEKQHRINDELSHEMFLYVVGDGGIQKMTYPKAQRMAEEQDMDLVHVGSKDNLPLCKIFNYEKFIYQQKKKKKESMHNRTEIKEIRITSNIAENDLKVKAKSIERFINDGNKVKVSLQFKGRENNNKEFYKKSLLNLIVMCEEFSVPEFLPKDEGNKTMTILKKKA